MQVNQLDDNEICVLRFMSEKWRSCEVAVESRDSLAGFDRAELHEWRLVLRLQNEWCSEVELDTQCAALAIVR